MFWRLTWVGGLNMGNIVACACEEVPHGPGYLAHLAEGSGAGNGSRGFAASAGADWEAFLREYDGRKNGYYPREIRDLFVVLWVPQGPLALRSAKYPTAAKAAVGAPKEPPLSSGLGIPCCETKVRALNPMERFILKIRPGTKVRGPQVSQGGGGVPSLGHGLQPVS